MTLTATQTTNNLQQFNDGFKAANYPVGTEGVLGKQDELQKKVDDALADLQTALSNGDSETLKAYLAFLSRFHNYSFGKGAIRRLRTATCEIAVFFRGLGS